MCGKDGRPVVGVVDVKKEPFDDALGVMHDGAGVFGRDRHVASTWQIATRFNCALARV